MKNIIKTWLKDHSISLPEERIDLLITMLKSEPKEECICGIEYDEDGERIEILCEEHNKQIEDKLRNEYQ